MNAITTPNLSPVRDASRDIPIMKEKGQREVFVASLALSGCIAKYKMRFSW